MATITQTSRYRDTILSREQIEALIAEGRKVVIVDGRVLKVDAWLPYHPGGDKAILHMVGRDATDEVKGFHSVETQEFMHKYQIGRIEGRWKDFVPPIQGGQFKSNVKSLSNSNPAVGNEAHDSSEEESTEPSPVFDPADVSTTGLRNRRVSHGANSDTSATSLESLDLDMTSDEDQKRLNKDQLAKQELQNDLDTFPSLDPETQTAIIEKYRALDKRIRAEGSVPVQLLRLLH